MGVISVAQKITTKIFLSIKLFIAQKLLYFQFLSLHQRREE